MHLVPAWSSFADALTWFASRLTNYTIDGADVEGIFAADLTASEIATLQAVHPPPLADGSGTDGAPSWADPADLQVATLEQLILLLQVGQRAGMGAPLAAWRACNALVRRAMQGFLCGCHQVHSAEWWA